MSIYITGDIHGEMHRLKPDMLGVNPSPNSYVIICGDFGLLFQKGEIFEKKLDIIKSLNYTVLWVDGNHENHDWIDSLPVETWNGGKVHKITDNCIHLMRGQIYNINGKTFFTFGGAKSIDKEFRIEGYSWWRREESSWQEQNEALDNLAKYNNKVDYIITHAAPNNILYRINPSFKVDNTTNFLYEIEKNTKFKHWYFGHYHDDKKMDDKHTMLLYDIKKIR